MLLLFSSLSLYMSIYIGRCIHVVAHWFQEIQRSCSMGSVWGEEDFQIRYNLLKLTQYFLFHGLRIRYDLSMSFLMKQVAYGRHNSQVKRWHGTSQAIDAIGAQVPRS